MSDPRLPLWIAAFAAIAGPIAACGDGSSTTDRTGLEQGIECRVPTGTGGGGRGVDPGADASSGEGPSAMDASTTASGDEDELPGCSADEICLAVRSDGRGRCYPRCESEDDCSRRETCNSSGACVPSGVDAAVPSADGGTGDPCSRVTCDDPTRPACHPAAAQDGVAGACFECSNRDTSACADGGVCNIGFGSCEAPQSRLCAPCEDAVDCGGLACVMRSDPLERVCLPRCGEGSGPDGGMADCPSGSTCDGSHCVPAVGSCTTVHAALEDAPCDDDSDCAAVGESPHAGLCGEMPIDGGTRPICRAPCAPEMGCPGGSACPDTTLCPY